MTPHRWEKGQSGNPKGRPKRKTEEQYLDIFKSIVTVDEARLIISKALVDAKRGDQQARKFIFDYLIGPPVERKELTGADGNAMIIRIIDDASGVSRD